MAGHIELWGFPTENIDEAKKAAERALGVSFQPHTSLHIGPYLFAILGEGAAELTLRRNLDPEFDPESDEEEEAYAEPEFPESGVLLYVDWTFDDEAARAKLDALASDAQLLTVEEDEEE